MTSTESFPRRDYAQWKLPLHRWDSARHLLTSDDLADGVHAVELGDTTVDLLMRGRPLDPHEHSHVLVFLAGAITGRSEKRGPFFSGLGIAGNLDMPVIAIADPGVEVHKDLNLAWYTGRLDAKFQSQLADLLAALAVRAGKPLLLVGGSGAGFACLQLAEHLGQSATALVWNPQTNLLDYHPGPVKSYLHRALGFSSTFIASATWRQDAAKRIEARLQSKLRGADAVSAARGVIYLQNRSDWHRENHLDPWLKDSSWVPMVAEAGEVFAVDPAHAVVVADFAEGHGPPEGKLIAELIGRIQNGESDMLEMARNLAKRHSAHP